MSAEESTRISVRFYGDTSIYDWYHVRLRDVVQYIASEWPVYATQNDVAIKSGAVGGQMLYFCADRVNYKAGIGCVFLQ